jgi:hypothetical protein
LIGSLCPPCFEAFLAALPAIPAGTPTIARPGSAEKIAILALRHDRGEQLHHPADVPPNLE